MSLKPVDCFTVVCDWPGCEADAFEGSDYVGGDLEMVDHVMDDCYSDGWHLGRDEKTHFCGVHPTIWAHLLFDAHDPEPARPYLLIHDGDTDNPEDDGRVSLVKPVTQALIEAGNVPLPIGAES